MPIMQHSPWNFGPRRWREVATHEAGHAVVGYLHGLPMSFASIGNPCPVDPVPGIDTLGRVRIHANPPTGDADRWRLALQAMAGPAAELMLTGECASDHIDLLELDGGGDWADAIRWAGTPENAWEHLLEVAELLANPAHWRAVVKLSHYLLAHGSVAEPALSELIRKAIAGGGILPPFTLR
jgi:hypothetical protein